MRYCAGLCLLCLLPASARADTGDDTISYILSKTELALVGALTAECIDVASEGVVIEYTCKIKVIEVVKGPDPKTDVLRITIVRFGIGQPDRLPYLKKDGKCIFFLKADPDAEGRWTTADPWIGVQPYNSVMVKAIKRLQKKQE